jgi:hypothetical protein
VVAVSDGFRKFGQEAAGSHDDGGKIFGRRFGRLRGRRRHDVVRELLEEGGVGESADAIWASLTAQRARMFSFDDTTAYHIKVNGTDLGNGQAFEVDRSAMSSEGVHKVAEPEPELWSHRTDPVPVFTWSAESESCRKSYPLGTRRRGLADKRSGQLSFFEMPSAL